MKLRVVVSMDIPVEKLELKNEIDNLTEKEIGEKMLSLFKDDSAYSDCDNMSIKVKKLEKK